MREEGATPSEGLDIKGLIKTYGPMAAAAAGVLLARGRGGREIIDMFKRIAPKHYAKLQESKIPYLVETDSPLFRHGHVSDKDASFFAPFSRQDMQVGQQFRHRGKVFSDLGELADTVQNAGHGSAPNAGIINVADTPHKLASSIHEFGHAVGFDRAASRLRDDTPTKLIQEFGSGHMDQFDNPKVQEMVKNAIVHDPSLKDYLGQYLMSLVSRGQSHQRGFGELVNESWAQTVQRKAGIRPRSMGDMPIFQENLGMRDKYEPQFRPYIDSAARFGKLPPGDHQQALAMLESLLRQHGRPPAPVSPSRPSPPASPAPLAARPGSPPYRRPPSPAESRPPR